MSVTPLSGDVDGVFHHALKLLCNNESTSLGSLMSLVRSGKIPKDGRRSVSPIVPNSEPSVIYQKNTMKGVSANTTTPIAVVGVHQSPTVQSVKAFDDMASTAARNDGDGGGGDGDGGDGDGGGGDDDEDGWDEEDEDEIIALRERMNTERSEKMKYSRSSNKSEENDNVDDDGNDDDDDDDNDDDDSDDDSDYDDDDDVVRIGTGTGDGGADVTIDEDYKPDSKSPNCTSSIGMAERRKGLTPLTSTVRPSKLLKSDGRRADLMHKIQKKSKILRR